MTINIDEIRKTLDAIIGRSNKAFQNSGECAEDRDTLAEIVSELLQEIDAQAAEIAALRKGQDVMAESFALQERDVPMTNDELSAFYDQQMELPAPAAPMTRPDPWAVARASATSAAPVTHDDDLGKFLRNASPENKADYGRLLAEASHAEARTEAPASAAAKLTALTIGMKSALRLINVKRTFPDELNQLTLRALLNRGLVQHTNDGDELELTPAGRRALEGSK